MLIVGDWRVSTAFLQKVGELNEGWGMHIPPGIPAHWCLWLDRRIKTKFLVFNPVRQCSFSCTSTSGGFTNSLKDVNMTYCEYYICIHLVYMYCIYVYIYIYRMQHFCPRQIKFESLESHIILVYQFLMKGFPIMKSLWARHPHKSPHNHTLHVPAKMNDSVLIIFTSW